MTRSNSEQILRYAYIKNGNVIDQLGELEKLNWEIPDGGPQAFIGDFLCKTKEDQILLLSLGKNSEKKVTGNTTAYVLRSIGKDNSTAVRAFSSCMVFFKVIGRLLIFKPTRILCGSSGFMLWACFLVSKTCSIPLVHSRHNRLFTNDKQPFYRHIGQAINISIVKRVNGVVCHGPYLRQQLIDAGVSESKIFEFDCGYRDFFNKAQRAPEPAIVTFDKRCFLILFVGRIEENKGVFDLLEACLEDLQQNKLKLIYAGTGSHSKQLEEMINKYELDKQVLLLGKLEHSRLGQLMHQCDILVTPTRSAFPEGRCMAAMEGLVMGLPVVAPNFGAFPYLIDDEVNGLLFEPDYVQGLRDCILKIIRDKKLYQSLRNGAKMSGSNLLDPPLRFSNAVDQAFQLKPL